MMPWPLRRDDVRRAQCGLVLTIMLSVLALPGTAVAQLYDGDGLLRFGVFGQGNLTDFDIRDRQTGTSDSVSLDGGGVGASFGYDYRFGHVVYGVEADGSVSNDNARFRNSTFATDFFASFRGRFGAYARPDLMIYGTFGLALAFVEFKPVAGTGVPVLDPNVVGSTSILKSSDTLVGLTIGGGLEYEPHENIILFGEYLYASYEDWNVGTRDGSTRLLIEPDSHQLRLGVKFKIGHDHRYDYDREGIFR